MQSYDERVSLARQHTFNVAPRLALPADDGLEQWGNQREPHDIARHARACVASGVAHDD